MNLKMAEFLFEDQKDTEASAQAQSDPGQGQDNQSNSEQNNTKQNTENKQGRADLKAQLDDLLTDGPEVEWSKVENVLAPNLAKVVFNLNQNLSNNAKVQRSVAGKEEKDLSSKDKENIKKSSKVEKLPLGILDKTFLTRLFRQNISVGLQGDIGGKVHFNPVQIKRGTEQVEGAFAADFEIYKNYQMYFFLLSNAKSQVIKCNGKAVIFAIPAFGADCSENLKLYSLLYPDVTEEKPVPNFTEKLAFFLLPFDEFDDLQTNPFATIRNALAKERNKEKKEVKTEEFIYNMGLSFLLNETSSPSTSNPLSLDGSDKYVSKEIIQTNFIGEENNSSYTVYLKSKDNIYYFFKKDSTDGELYCVKCNAATRKVEEVTSWNKFLDKYPVIDEEIHESSQEANQNLIQNAINKSKNDTSGEGDPGEDSDGGYEFKSKFINQIKSETTFRVNVEDEISLIALHFNADDYMLFRKNKGEDFKLVDLPSKEKLDQYLSVNPFLSDEAKLVVVKNNLVEEEQKDIIIKLIEDNVISKLKGMKWFDRKKNRKETLKKLNLFDHYKQNKGKSSSSKKEQEVEAGDISGNERSEASDEDVTGEDKEDEDKVSDRKIEIGDNGIDGFQGVKFVAAAFVWGESHEKEILERIKDDLREFDSELLEDILEEVERLNPGGRKFDLDNFSVFDADFSNFTDEKDFEENISAREKFDLFGLCYKDKEEILNITKDHKQSQAVIISLTRHFPSFFTSFERNRMNGLDLPLRLASLDSISDEFVEELYKTLILDNDKLKKDFYKRVFKYKADVDAERAEKENAVRDSNIGEACRSVINSTYQKFLRANKKELEEAREEKGEVQELDRESGTKAMQNIFTFAAGAGTVAAIGTASWAVLPYFLGSYLFSNEAENVIQGVVRSLKGLTGKNKAYVQEARARDDDQNQLEQSIASNNDIRQYHLTSTAGRIEQDLKLLGFEGVSISKEAVTLFEVLSEVSEEANRLEEAKRMKSLKFLLEDDNKKKRKSKLKEINLRDFEEVLAGSGIEIKDIIEEDEKVYDSFIAKVSGLLRKYFDIKIKGSIKEYSQSEEVKDHVETLVDDSAKKGQPASPIIKSYTDELSKSEHDPTRALGGALSDINNSGSNITKILVHLMLTNPEGFSKIAESFSGDKADAIDKMTKFISDAGNIPEAKVQKSIVQREEGSGESRERKGTSSAQHIIPSERGALFRQISSDEDARHYDAKENQKKVREAITKIINEATKLIVGDSYYDNLSDDKKENSSSVLKNYYDKLNKIDEKQDFLVGLITLSLFVKRNEKYLTKESWDHFCESSKELYSKIKDVNTFDKKAFLKHRYNEIAYTNSPLERFANQYSSDDQIGGEIFNLIVIWLNGVIIEEKFEHHFKDFSNKLEKIVNIKSSSKLDVSETFIRGDLSSLLFEEVDIISSNKKRNFKKKNNRIDLREEWLRIWDI